jgi:hypothetical protein
MTDTCKHGIPKDSIWGCQDCADEIFPAATISRMVNCLQCGKPINHTQGTCPQCGYVEFK